MLGHAAQLNLKVWSDSFYIHLNVGWILLTTSNGYTNIYKNRLSLSVAYKNDLFIMKLISYPNRTLYD